MPDISQYFPITDTTWIFLVVLFIILSAPVIMSKLRIPHIVGMVLAGVIVGQYGLNILERDASFEMFGKVGLYYIMFLAGLEMDMEGIKKNSRRMLLFGLMTFAIPFVMVYYAGIYLMDYSMQASLLLSCILASNTLIAYPIVCKYGLQKHPVVTLCVGSSMISLLFALIAFSGVVGSVSSEADVWFWLLMAAKLIGYCCGMSIIIPRVARWFLQHYSDAVMQFVFVLLVLFLSAALTEMMGLEGVFGAFFAGLVLNRYIPHVSPLMSRIEFTGNALFIPYFLIGVGMLIDIRVLFGGWHTVYIVFCMVFFGTIAKMIAAYIASFGMKMPMAHGNMMFGLTSAHAAGSIAIVMVGMKLYIGNGQYLVDSDMLNGVVMMILFTCVISSFVTEHASQQIVLDDNMYAEDEHTADDEKILIPIKRQTGVDNLVPLAIMMRNSKLNRGIIGLNVVLDDKDVVRNQAQGKRILEAAAKAASAADVRMLTQSRIAANIANGIMHAFKEYDASEIIIGMHEKKTENDNFWGVFTENLFTELNRQIMVCRLLQPLSTIRRIQVAVPSRVEFEPGFYRWIERLSVMSENMGCRIQFHGRTESMSLIREYIQNRHPSVRADYILMQHWKEITALSDEIKEDHLLVVITARTGTVSYKTAFERLPEEIGRCFANRNLIIVFPDQNGQPMESMTFTAPQKHNVDSAYAILSKWFKEKLSRNK